MKIRWLILFLPAAVLLVLSLAVHEHAARARQRSVPGSTAGPPQSA